MRLAVCVCQSGSFVLELPRLCATVSLSRFAPKRPSLTLGSGKVVTSPVTLAFGEIAETTVRAVVTAPNEKLCARFNITVRRLEMGRVHRSLGMMRPSATISMDTCRYTR